MSRLISPPRKDRFLRPIRNKVQRLLETAKDPFNQLLIAVEGLSHAAYRPSQPVNIKIHVVPPTVERIEVRRRR
jgi:hypothetical protein